MANIILIIIISINLAYIVFGFIWCQFIAPKYYQKKYFEKMKVDIAKEHPEETNISGYEIRKTIWGERVRKAR